MTRSAIVLVGTLSVIALFWIPILRRWWRQPDALVSVSPAQIENALRQLVELRSDDAVMRLDGADNDQDHFEVRFVANQLRFEYQVVHPKQLQNERRIRSAFASLGYECMEWGDGSYEWDKYIFVELGRDPATARRRIDDLLRSCTGIAAKDVSVTLQDFAKLDLVV